MDNNKKIYRKSGVTIVCYVFAAILLLYTCYVAGNTVGQINEYYAQYAQMGISAQPMDYITLVAQNGLPYLTYAFTVFMLGYILDDLDAGYVRRRPQNEADAQMEPRFSEEAAAEMRRTLDS